MEEDTAPTMQYSRAVNQEQGKVQISGDRIPDKVHACFLFEGTECLVLYKNIGYKPVCQSNRQLHDSMFAIIKQVLYVGIVPL